MDLLADIIIMMFISCILLANGLVFIRKLILLHYGYPAKGLMYMCFWLDVGELNEVIENEESKRRRTFFKWINILIPALFIGNVLFVLLAGVISCFV